MGALVMTRGKTVKSWAMMTAACMALGAPVFGVVPLAASAKADAPAAAPAAPVRYFRIVEQDLVAALNEFGRQSGRDILFSTDVAAKRRSPGVHGAMSAEDALRTLLARTGLSFRATSERTFLVELAQAETQPSTGRDPATDTSDDEGKKVEGDRKVERVVVTGTNIRGKHPKSSPLDVYTRKDIERSGATTTEQFIQKLPQNFATRNQFAPGAISQGRLGNGEGVNSIDLRGLGVSTTLTLLNGRRLALANNGQAADVSLIPLAAIDRVEVLTDGASAIYGSDAIGGVVNFILRDDFDGAETRVASGGVTSGGLRQGEISQTFGANWSSGHGLITGGASSFSSLKTTDRDYAAATGPGTLTPIDQRHSVLATVSQDINDRIQLNGDFVFSSRSVKNDASAAGAFPELSRSTSNTEQYFANLGADIALSPQLDASFLASYSSVDVDSTFFQEFPTFGLSFATPFDSQHAGFDLTAQLSGTAFELPGGSVQFSLGGGYMDEDARGVRAATVAVSPDIGRTTSYAFGEVLIPFVSEAQNIPFVRRLELSLAARYTSHEDTSSIPLRAELGSDIVPKVGLLWSPFDGLNVRGTYGESFRAPSLSELDPTRDVTVLFRQTVAGVANTPVMTVTGSSSLIVPENSASYTLGVDYRPELRPQASFSTTYFNIDYTNQIQDGGIFASAALVQPASFPDFIYRPTSAAQIEEILRTYRNITNTLGINLSDPTTAASTIFAIPNFWIIDARVLNLMSSRLDGLDISFEDAFDTEWGEIYYGANVTQIFSYRQQASSTALTTSGVDVVGRPADLRGRVYLGGSVGDWDTTLSINYVDDYDNPFAPGGTQTVDNWPTFDLVASYQFQSATLGLSIQNLFDEEPPAVTRSAVAGPFGLRDSVGFDPSNANPLGRFIVVSFTQRW
jgi:iron complex outermembrane receptor protein